MVVPDLDVIPVEPAEAGKRTQRVEIIVEDGNLHECAPTPPSWLFHRQQFDVEHQRRIRRDRAAGAARTVAERGRNDQRALAADFHAGDALVPALDYAALADGKLERLVA